MDKHTHTRHRNILYDALVARDKSYDGHVFFGVTSTGIFCRPICPAPKPKRENVLFFSSAETAMMAGFRACKRCRPESRPGSPAWEGTKATVSRALRLLAQPDSPDSLNALSNKLGITDRHLRRLFEEHVGKSPIAIKTENRLGLAKTLLAGSNATIADIAFSSGFRSLRRFNDAFKSNYNVTPSVWRRQNGTGAKITPRD